MKEALLEGITVTRRKEMGMAKTKVGMSQCHLKDYERSTFLH